MSSLFVYPMVAKPHFANLLKYIMIMIIICFSK